MFVCRVLLRGEQTKLTLQKVGAGSLSELRADLSPEHIQFACLRVWALDPKVRGVEPFRLELVM